MWGEEVERTYEDGRLVSETRHERDMWGDSVDRTYDREGKKVSETRSETTMWGEQVERTRDSDGRRVSTTSHERDSWGDRVDRTRDLEGRLVSETRSERDMWGDKLRREKRVSSGARVKPSAPRRAESPQERVRSDSYSTESHASQAESDDQAPCWSFWGSLFEGLASVAGFFGTRGLAAAFNRMAIGSYASSRMYFHAGKLAERTGRLEEAVKFYTQEPYSYSCTDIMRLCDNAQVLPACIEALKGYGKYEDAARVAESGGLYEESVNLFLLAAEKEDPEKLTLGHFYRAFEVSKRHNLADLTKRVASAIANLRFDDYVHYVAMFGKDSAIEQAYKLRQETIAALVASRSKR